VKQSAVYVGCSEDTIQYLIAKGRLPVVRLPVAHRRNGRRDGQCRRIIIDRNDLDDLIVKSKA